MNDWANRNLVHIILFLIIKEILNNLRILLKMIRLLHQLIPIGLTVSSKKILSASVIWISLNDLSEHDISELEVVRDEIFHLHLSKVQKIASWCTDNFILNHLEVVIFQYSTHLVIRG